MIGLHLPRLLVLLPALACTGAPAQSGDPTRPPPAPGAAAADRHPVPGSVPAAPPELPVVRQLLVVDGRRYVVAGSRLYGEGDRLGAWRVERIEDAAVLLRQRQQLHRVNLHAQVDKRPAAPAPTTTERANPR